MKAVVAAFNQEKALVGAFSVIVKTGCGTDGSFYSTTLNTIEYRGSLVRNVMSTSRLPRAMASDSGLRSARLVTVRSAPTLFYSNS